MRGDLLTCNIRGMQGPENCYSPDLGDRASGNPVSSAEGHAGSSGRRHCSDGGGAGSRDSSSHGGGGGASGGGSLRGGHSGVASAARTRGLQHPQGISRGLTPQQEQVHDPAA